MQFQKARLVAQAVERQLELLLVEWPLPAAIAQTGPKTQSVVGGAEHERREHTDDRERRQHRRAARADQLVNDTQCGLGLRWRHHFAWHNEPPFSWARQRLFLLSLQGAERSRESPQPSREKMLRLRASFIYQITVSR